MHAFIFQKCLGLGNCGCLLVFIGVYFLIVILYSYYYSYILFTFWYDIVCVFVGICAFVWFL